MGMLIRRHRDRLSEDATEAPKRKRNRKGNTPEQVDPPEAHAAAADNAPDTEPEANPPGE